MRWYFRIIVILLYFSLISACKKYEEGPALSFRSKKARLENKWKYDEILVNTKTKELTDTDRKFRLKFDKEGLAIKEIANASGPASYVGNWYWQEHKEKLKTVFDYTYFGNPIHEITEYKILKLKNKNLWLEEITSSGDTCHYRLIPD